MLVARVLGLGFSLILAKVLTPDDFGYIQYALAVASVLAVVAHPFGQHVLARFISGGQQGLAGLNAGVSQSSHERTARADSGSTDVSLDTLLSNCWIVFVCLLGLTLLASSGFIWISSDLGFELLPVVFGIAFFYAYWGVSRGYMRSGLLTTSYLGSNVVQLLLISLLIWYLEIHSTALALIIYGLSYIPVIVWLQTQFPLKIYFNLSKERMDFGLIKKVLRFSIPITLSHAAFMLFVATDILLLNRMVEPDVVGRYALAKTLATAFSFVPMGIATLLMPRIAGADSGNHLSLLYRSVLASLGINIMFLCGFWLLVEWFVHLFFGIEYLVGINIYMILAFGAMMLGIQSIAAATYVGRSRPEIETMGRGIAALCVFVGCWLLIPRFGEAGAAVSVLAGSIAALLVYLGHGIKSMVYSNEKINL